MKGLSMIFLALAMVLVSKPSTAQGCGPYQFCTGGGGDHRVGCPSGDGVQNCHWDCGSCILGECHPDCGLGSLNPLDRKNNLALLAAAQRADVAEVVALASRLPGRVLFNPRRNAVQVTGCTGLGIVASLPVSDPVVVIAARTGLPHVSTHPVVALSLRWSGALFGSP